MDAMHAFVCALHGDARNQTAWFNLAVLYERHEQWEEALKCYKCALMAVTGLEELAEQIDFETIFAQYIERLG